MAENADPAARGIVFFHPDLGIGGAERLIVDAAVGLQNLGHKVTIFTSYHDSRHCFDETRDGTLDVRVRGNLIFPTAFLGRFHILCAILRQIHLLLAVTLFSKELVTLNPSVFLVDQLSACVPLLRWLYPTKPRILFYCHFPDQLLAKCDAGILSLLKKAYRFPFDWFEGWSTSASDRIVVNSNFTKSVARQVFPNLNQDLGVIYPCVEIQNGTEGTTDATSTKPLWPGYKYILSINRFERKKSIELAIRAYHALPPKVRSSTRLVIAGGYDLRVPENVQYHNELIFLSSSLGLSTATAKTVPTALAIPKDIEVLFLLSVPGPFKSTLLRHASLLVYTPTNEHFGIVPVEAMAHGVPVLATNTGGPLETIVEGQTGWLRSPEKLEDWTKVMRMVLQELSVEDLSRMAEQGKRRARSDFSPTTMAQRFQGEIEAMIGTPRRPFIEWRDILLALGVLGIFLTGLLTVLFKQPSPRPGVTSHAQSPTRMPAKKVEPGRKNEL